jgi:hypothetical protein
VAGVAAAVIEAEKAIVIVVVEGGAEEEEYNMALIALEDSHRTAGDGCAHTIQHRCCCGYIR